MSNCRNSIPIIYINCGSLYKTLMGLEPIFCLILGKRLSFVGFKVKI